MAHFRVPYCAWIKMSVRQRPWLEKRGRVELDDVVPSSNQVELERRDLKMMNSRGNENAYAYSRCYALFSLALFGVPCLDADDDLHLSAFGVVDALRILVMANEFLKGSMIATVEVTVKRKRIEKSAATL